MAERPDICIAVCDAFEAAKKIALDELSGFQALTVSHPWAPVEAARMQEFFGDEFWSYGVDANRASLDAVIRWSFAPGITARQLTIEDIFPAPALDWKKY